MKPRYGFVLAISGARSPIRFGSRAKMMLGQPLAQKFETLFRRIHQLKKIRRLLGEMVPASIIT